MEFEISIDGKVISAYEELSDAIALYREGISLNNPFHQFLNLWRCYENALRVRSEWRKLHKTKDVRVYQEVLPDIASIKRNNSSKNHIEMI